MKRQTLFKFVSILCVISLWAGMSYAQIPTKINYQGYLSNSSGSPVDAIVSMTFAIYDAETGGTSLWSETQQVPVSQGRYNVLLGEVKPINLTKAIPYYLGVAVESDPEMTPREPITSTMYSLFTKGMEEVTVENGNVGIGTSSPQEKLDVNGDIRLSNYLRFNGPLGKTITGGSPEVGIAIYPYTTALNSLGWFQLWGDDGSPRAGELDLAGAYINFRHAVTNAGWGNIGMQLAANGNVGIGILDPTHKLTVNGAIRSREVLVDNNSWPDFVFDTDYHLMPLSEVEQHINTRKHLPGIPSAKEVEEQGLSVGDMQAKLLQKVEELTLHLIALEKENARLRERVTVLEEQIK